MKIYERADANKTAPCGATYSWALYAVQRNSDTARNLVGAGWEWAEGRPGCFVANDPDLAARTATALCLDVVSDGTHAVLDAPVMLCDPLPA